MRTNFNTVQTARKNHGPCRACLAPIVKGDRYFRFAVPAWFDGEGDGHSRWIQTKTEHRRWSVEKHHITCPYMRGKDGSQTNVQVRSASSQ